MDNYLVNNLDIIMKEAIPNKWDAVIVVHGKEGSGKTTFSTQLAIYMDNSFCLNRCVFNPDKFGNILDSAQEESSIIWDEAITGASSVKHASKVSQEIISRLTMIRRKRLKIILCLPYLWMLNKYFISRCVATFYVYAKGFTRRGYYIAYNQTQTEWLFSLMKEKYQLLPSNAIYKAKSAFHATFPNVFCLPENEYEKKKEEAGKTIDLKEDKWKDRAIISAVHWKGTQLELAKLWNVTRQYIGQLGKKEY